MKAALRAFFSYSLVERTGFIAVGSLLLLLLAARGSLSWWVDPPAPDPALAATLSAEYAAWRATQEDAEAVADEGRPALHTESFPFDPNTLDSAGFIRLGMPPKAVKGLLNWRRKGKRFYRAADLEPLYNLPADCYARLAPLVRITDTRGAGRFERPEWKRETAPSIIELNTADSATLDRWVPGIGAVLARKIVARREALGGFLDLGQLTEVYRFPDSTMNRLRERLSLDPRKCRLIDLNSVSLERLAAHPYIGEKLGRNMLMYREALGAYTDLTQLRQVPLMTAEIYRKIAPYFSLPTHAK